MCTVSMIGDYYGEKWGQPDYKWVFDNINNVTRQEFEALKKEVEDMKELLKRAKIYDEKNNEPDCELEEKMKKLREIANIVGVDIDEILGKKR